MRKDYDTRTSNPLGNYALWGNLMLGQSLGLEDVAGGHGNLFAAFSHLANLISHETLLLL